jgi:poly(3-hydroxybutyrate) depolymerase
MAIGEFAGAAALPVESGALLATPMYWFYELGHAALNPSRALADATRLFFKNPANPFAHTPYGKSVAAAAELFERSTRRYDRPEWRIDHATVGGERVPVDIKTIWERPF